MADTTNYPTYPTGSFNFLRRLRARQANDSVNGEKKISVKLNVVVVGAGVGGLCTAIALRRKGHDVTIYEAASVLSEIGAGIQVPPNSSRILHSWGLEPNLTKKSVKPEALIWRRWQNGKAIGHTKLNPQLPDWLGSPYYVTHRAHLHQVLHEAVVKLGVPIKLSSRVRTYNMEEPSMILEDGSQIQADLIVAADGVKSTARKQLFGDADRGPQTYGLAAFRATVAVSDIKANPQTAWVAESRSLNLWVGDNQHAMTYTIAGGELFNLVLTYPESTDPSTWKQENEVNKMKAQYVGWDPSLTQILEMVTHTLKWPIQQIEVPDTWCHRSGKFMILGDAAHAMLPNMALGAAMAVEDAAALAECLDFMSSKKDLGRALKIYEDIRMPRVKKVHEASVLHGRTLHFPDGPEQEARDVAMRPEVEGTHFVESPNQWSDPTMQVWVYAHDVVDETRAACLKRCDDRG